MALGILSAHILFCFVNQGFVLLLTYQAFTRSFKMSSLGHKSCFYIGSHCATTCSKRCITGCPRLQWRPGRNMGNGSCQPERPERWQSAPSPAFHESLCFYFCKRLLSSRKASVYQELNSRTFKEKARGFKPPNSASLTHTRAFAWWL